MYILCKPIYVNTCQDAKLIGLGKLAIDLTGYGGTDIEVLGSSTANITVREHTSSVKFIITDTSSPNILSYKDSMKVQLVLRINNLSVLDRTVIIDKYPHMFVMTLVPYLVNILSSRSQMRNQYNSLPDRYQYI